MGIIKKGDEFFEESDFEIGDEVVVSWMMKSEIGHVSSKSFHAFSPIAGGCKSVMIKFKDREVAVWIAIVNKIEIE